MNGEGEDVFSGEVGTQPQMVNVQTPGTMMMVERSPAAQVMGILVILWSLFQIGMNILGLAALSFLSGVEEAGIEELPIMLFAGFITPLPYNYWQLKFYGRACH